MNLFDDHSKTFLVLINEEGQYSLWPTLLNVPAGWRIIYGEENRENCLNYINLEWKSMMPNKLSEQFANER